MFHDTKEEGVLDAVKGFLSISKDEQSRGSRDISIVDEVTDVEGVVDTGFAFLASDLGRVNKPGEGVHERVGKAACKDFVEDGADGDGAVVGEEGAGAFLVYEGGNGDIPVGGKVAEGKAFVEDVDDERDHAAGLGALSGTRGVFIIRVRAIGGGFEDKEFEEFRGETVRARDSTKGKTADRGFSGVDADDGVWGGKAVSMVGREEFVVSRES